MTTVAALIGRHGVDIDEHLDRQVAVPVLTGMQRQGDVLVVPDAKASASTPVPSDGVPVVRGEAGGNTHLLLADGDVRCDLRGASVNNLALAAVDVADGATAYLAHPEHGYMAIGAGTYTIRRQREQADELRIVAD